MAGLPSLSVPPVELFRDRCTDRPFARVVWCYTGRVEQSDAAFRPVRDFAPVFDGIGPMPYPALQSAFDAIYPPGLQWYWRADFVNELSDRSHRAPR